MIGNEERGGDGDPLVERDPRAWSALYDRVYPIMMNYALRRLPTSEQARDCVAEALVRVVATRERLVEASSPEAWCIGVLRHVVADTHRHTYRERDRAIDVGPVPDGPEDVAARDDEHRVVRDAFERLDAADREVLELRVVAGLSSDEVAEVLESTPGAVRMAQSRALDRLRRLMGEEVSA